MSMVINPDRESLELLRQRAALLAEIQSERNPSGDVHPRTQEFNDLTSGIQMHLGNLAFEQAIALAEK